MQNMRRIGLSVVQLGELLRFSCQASQISLGGQLFVREPRPISRLFDAHRDAIAKRGQSEGRTPSFQMVVDDVYAISKGQLIGRPS